MTQSTPTGSEGSKDVSKIGVVQARPSAHENDKSSKTSKTGENEAKNMSEGTITGELSQGSNNQRSQRWRKGSTPAISGQSLVA